MTQFTGQMSARGLGGTFGDVWQFAPFYVKVIFVVKTLSSYVFEEYIQ